MPTPPMSNDATKAIAQLLESDLFQQHGPMMRDEDLRRALGFRTLEAFRQAFYRGDLPVPVFPIEKRRGKFALTRDVAHWLAAQRAAIDDTSSHRSHKSIEGRDAP